MRKTIILVTILCLIFPTIVFSTITDSEFGGNSPGTGVGATYTVGQGADIITDVGTTAGTRRASEETWALDLNKSNTYYQIIYEGVAYSSTYTDNVNWYTGIPLGDFRNPEPVIFSEILPGINRPDLVEEMIQNGFLVRLNIQLWARPPGQVGVGYDWRNLPDDFQALTTSAGSWFIDTLVKSIVTGKSQVI